ncbi:hypothetical protein CYMTET_47050 [Cymbomonas tetramitiformis]|uniref:Uncharacterized protein n=1 Tax=Cymbomonas tetramitiformis TaxID=36881 RepID=A0AAE0BUY9_9CHLO|nr:hypothetical protein CYMTET_47050 [Cymbomonas tetramitiformis]
MRGLCLALYVLYLLCVSQAIEPPYLQTTDNLEEPNGVHFCLDLRGWNPVSFTNMQAHSCKPSGSAGGGTDEMFEFMDGVIEGRADAEGHCVEARDAAIESRIDAPVCDRTNSLQGFCYDTDGTLKLSSSAQFCLVVSPQLRQAGSWWGRNLYMDLCENVESQYKTWTQVKTDTLSMNAGTGCGTSGCLRLLRGRHLHHPDCRVYNAQAASAGPRVVRREGGAGEGVEEVDRCKAAATCACAKGLMQPGKPRGRRQGWLAAVAGGVGRVATDTLSWAGGAGGGERATGQDGLPRKQADARVGVKWVGEAAGDVREAVLYGSG